MVAPASEGAVLTGGAGGGTLSSVLVRFAGRYLIAPIPLPPVVVDWRVFELVPEEQAESR